MYTSQKMPLHTSKEQKAKIYWFLLSPDALSNCNISIGGRGRAGSGSSRGGRRESKQVPAPFRSACVKVDWFPSIENNVRDKFLGGPSKSRNNLAIDPIV